MIYDGSATSVTQYILSVIITTINCAVHIYQGIHKYRNDYFVLLTIPGHSMAIWLHLGVNLLDPKNPE